MRLIAFLLAFFCLLVPNDAARSAFAIFQLGSSSSSTAAVICNAITGVATGVGAGTCMSAPAACDGVADDSAAFATFTDWAVNTWQASHAGQIELLIPPGKTCTSGSNIQLACYTASCTGFIKNLLVVGTGSTLQDSVTSGWNFGTFGICQKGIAESDGCSARIATVSAGATSVTLVNSALASRFTIGQYVMVSGFDLQGSGYPTNPAFFEFALVSNIVGGTITLSAPLQNSYKSTWPLYFAGNNLEADQGGPATIYSLPVWDTTIEWRGMTINSAHAVTGLNSNGRNQTFRNIAFTGLSGNCVIPSQTASWSLIDSDLATCTTEADKLAVSLILTRSSVGNLVFQSTSAVSLTGTGNTLAFLTGSPKSMALTSTTIGTFTVGATNYGNTNSVSCLSCVITTINPNGLVDKGPADVGVNLASGWSMSGGVITIPTSDAPRAWLTPGANNFWQGAFFTETAFQIVDVTQSGGNILVQTSLASGFPPVATNGGKLYIQTHPAPQFTCTGCTGSAETVNLAQTPAGSPILSYSNKTYVGAALTNVSPQTTNATTAAGNAVLHFASVPAWVTVGMKLANSTSPSTIRDGTEVLSKTATTITMTMNAAGSGVGSGDTIAITNTFTVWGKLAQINATVNTACTVAASLTTTLLGQFTASGLDPPNYSAATGWGGTTGGVINLKTTGLRTITPSAVTGNVTGDSLTAPGLVWFSGSQYPFTSADPAGCGVQPSLTIEVTTDQGVVIPFAMDDADWSWLIGDNDNANWRQVM